MSQKIGEFGLIEHIRKLFAPLVPPSMEGIGDDCAVIDGQMVVTTDMLCQDVHFRLPTDGFALGRRAVQVNLSDVAAMGARPTAIFLSVAVPVGVDDEFVESFFRGVHSCNVPLLGGDTTHSKSMLCINITALGTAPPENLKRRSAAQIGDAILVCGKLGGSAASNFIAPVTAQCEQGAWLGSRKQVHAMMDLSDGLAGDLPHILTASAVGATVELSRIPIADGATMEQALGGGEDFVLLLTCDADSCTQLQTEYFARFHTPLYNIGTITPLTNQLTWTKNDNPTPIAIRGFTHF